MSNTCTVPYRETPKGDPRFKNLLDRLWLLHCKKAADYGTDLDPLANIRAGADVGISAPVSCWIRAKDKVKRIDQYMRKGELANESVQDSLQDLASYSLIALLLIWEESEQAPAQEPEATPEQLRNMIAGLEEAMDKADRAAARANQPPVREGEPAKRGYHPDNPEIKQLDEKIARFKANQPPVREPELTEQQAAKLWGLVVEHGRQHDHKPHSTALEQELARLRAVEDAAKVVADAAETYNRQPCSTSMYRERMALKQLRERLAA